MKAYRLQIKSMNLIRDEQPLHFFAIAVDVPECEAFIVQDQLSWYT